MNIGIIADGNGRWAERQGLPRCRGHEAGADNVAKIVGYLKGKTDYLVLFGFSTENWNRPKEEVEHLFRIMETHMNGSLLEACIRDNIRIHHFGKRNRLPKSFLESIDRAKRLTKENKGLEVGFCLDYGGREELVQAAAKAMGGDFSKYLYTRSFPDMDLIIRTGGEHRLSNFLPWQSIYAEIYFTDTLFPDLEEKELDKILDWYKEQNRTFGK